MSVQYGNVKKYIGFMSKTTAMYVQHAFWYISLTYSLHDYNVKRPYATFYEGREHTDETSFLFFNLGTVPKHSALGKFA